MTKNTVYTLLCVSLITLLHRAPLLANPEEHAEAVEEITEVTDQTPAAMSVTTIVAKLHPAVVHMPIAWALLLLLLELLLLMGRQPDLERWGQPLLYLTLISFIPAAISGFLRLNGLPAEESAQPEAQMHRNMMLMAFVLLAAGAALRRQNTNANASSRRIYVALVIVAMGLITFAGHLGGELAYGKHYLPF